MTDKNHNRNHDDIGEPEDPQVTELVAYLDGELPELDADRVEQLLQSSPLLRRNAETLDRTWRMLDSLEVASASGDFSRKTLLSISSVSAGNDIDTAARPPWSLKQLIPSSLAARELIWILAGFLACSSGLLLSRNTIRDRTESIDTMILKDLNLYRQYPRLWHIPDVEFLTEISTDTTTSPLTADKP